MNPYGLDQFERPKLEAPGGASHVLMHSCCAPCAGEVMEAVHASGIDMTLFFYNPNIHPRDEYELRKSENKRFADKLGIPFVDADYDTSEWFKRVKGLENEPERGARCQVCFDMRFERSALYAREHGIPVLTSTLGISQWKVWEHIADAGHRAANRWEGMQYWDFNWRKRGGSQRMIEISRRERFYKQEYCGCVYSLRDTNRWLESTGRPRIERGVNFYGVEVSHPQARSNQTAPA